MYPPLWSRLLLQLLLICLGAIFAAAELSILSLDENDLRRQAEEGDRRAACLEKLLRRTSRTRTTALPSGKSFTVMYTVPRLSR